MAVGGGAVSKRRSQALKVAPRPPAEGGGKGRRRRVASRGVPPLGLEYRTQPRHWFLEG